MSGSTYEEFLQWKEDKYNFDVQAKKDHTVIEMEPIAINRPVSDDHRHATPAESKPVKSSLPVNHNCSLVLRVVMAMSDAM